MSPEERAPYDPMPHGPDEVGVGPWEGPLADRGAVRRASCWRSGDRRNVVDRYRYWTIEAIVADLDTRRHDFHVAIENWRHDFNIGTIVRTANAFLAARGAHRRQAHAGTGAGRWSPTATSTFGTTRRRRRLAAHLHEQGVRPDGRRQPAGLGAPGDLGDAEVGLLPVRPGGPWSLRRGPRASATGPSRSRSSARPARSTPPRPRPSRCTPGWSSTPTSATPGGLASRPARAGT